MSLMEFQFRDGWRFPRKWEEDGDDGKKRRRGKIKKSLKIQKWRIRTEKIWWMNKDKWKRDTRDNTREKRE